MRPIITYTLFEKLGDPSTGKLKRYPVDQFTKDTGKKLSPSIGNKANNWVSNFMGKIFNDPETWGSSITSRADKDHNGKPLDAGLGFLVGTVGSAAKGISSKILAQGQDLDIVDGKKLGTPEHQNLFIDNFIKNDMNKIGNKGELSDYLKDFYKSNGIRPGELPAADEAAENMATSWVTSPAGASELAGAAEELGPLALAL